MRECAWFLVAVCLIEIHEPPLGAGIRCAHLIWPPGAGCLTISPRLSLIALSNTAWSALRAGVDALIARHGPSKRKGVTDTHYAVGKGGEGGGSGGSKCHSSGSGAYRQRWCRGAVGRFFRPAGPWTPPELILPRRPFSVRAGSDDARTGRAPPCLRDPPAAGRCGGSGATRGAHDVAAAAAG